jgi:hypothetical protein
LNPTLKKVIAAAAITKGVQQIRKRREQKRPTWTRVAPFAAVAGVAACAFTALAKSGKLDDIVGRARTIATDIRSDGTEQPAPATG